LLQCAHHDARGHWCLLPAHSLLNLSTGQCATSCWARACFHSVSLQVFVLVLVCSGQMCAGIRCAALQVRLRFQRWSRTVCSSPARGAPVRSVQRQLPLQCTALGSRIPRGVLRAMQINRCSTAPPIWMSCCMR
jgi:hypothetical protein